LTFTPAAVGLAAAGGKRACKNKVSYLEWVVMLVRQQQRHSQQKMPKQVENRQRQQRRR